MFAAINYILFEKNLEELDNEILNEFSPYMVSRYFTFYDSAYTNYTNDTVNTYGSVFPVEEDKFSFYDNIIPKVKRKKINYVKKNKEPKMDEEPTICPPFYSKREIEMLTKMFK